MSTLFPVEIIVSELSSYVSESTAEIRRVLMGINVRCDNNQVEEGYGS